MPPPMTDACTGHGWGHRRRYDRVPANAGRSRGCARGTPGGGRPGDELGQCWHGSARPLVRLVVAAGADDPSEVAIRKEPGSALSAVSRSPSMGLVLAISAPMHGGTGAHQYAAQAPPVRVLAEDPARDCRQQRSII